ncbi:MBL fold metallo-hydrolase [Natronohydrobacter thiooxidans]|uniref:MBL fold metallo-hydrolase n=1 Tax=Natronohydrobacter thiooxidans TaxID=87172 RepID=UPI001FEB12E7|nr:MBL fold metallo-hydrolase [Natronohydrobacter thiooxidans]
MQRRHFLQHTGALALGLALPYRVQARTTLGFGPARIDMLSDGHLVLPLDFLGAGVPPEELDPILARHGLTGDVYEPPCNLVLLREADRTVLFDIGAGPDFMPTTGQLSDALDALGVRVEDITHLIITHAHPDHLWGLLDDFDEPLLPRAEIFMGRAEWDYWMDPDTVETIGAARQSFAVGAQRRLTEIEDQVQLFEDGAEILPGVQAVSTPGHTPGHMAFALQAGGQGLMVVGDALANPHLAFERPEWEAASDHIPDMAAATRLQLLDRITAEERLILGFHLPGGGIGRAERQGKSRYIFTTEV